MTSVVIKVIADGGVHPSPRTVGATRYGDKHRDSLMGLAHFLPTSRACCLVNTGCAGPLL